MVAAEAVKRQVNDHPEHQGQVAMRLFENMDVLMAAW